MSKCVKGATMNRGYRELNNIGRVYATKELADMVKKVFLSQRVKGGQLFIL
jgi:DNA-binding transcriptional regulator YhcF (GntR family)